MTMPGAWQQNPWDLAGPLHYLTLLERLGVRMSEVARWLCVPRSSISMWRHGTRAVPAKHTAVLRQRASVVFAQAKVRNSTAKDVAPTAALRQALDEEFAAVMARWEAEILADSTTIISVIERHYALLGMIVSQGSYSPEALARVQSLTETLLQQIRWLTSGSVEERGA